MDVLDLDAVGQADALRRREVSAAELAQAAQARIAEGGLPVGVQLVGAPGSDALLLRLAAALEAVFGWDRRPLPPRRSR